MDRGPSSTSSATASSRISTFRLFGKGSSRRDRPPTPPAKDLDKTGIPFAYPRYNASSPSLLHNRYPMQTPSTGSPKETFLSPATTSPPSSGVKSPASSKFLSKFTSLGRRARNGSFTNGSGRSTSAGSSAGHEGATTNDEFEVIDHSSADDGSISRPWNFQHHVHVDEQFIGLPPSWASALAEKGYTEEEIQNFQRQRAQGRSQALYCSIDLMHDNDQTITLNNRRPDSLRMGSPNPELQRPGSPFSTTNSITQSSNSRPTHSANDSFAGSASRARQRAPTPLRVVNPEGLQIDVDSDSEEGGAHRLGATDEAISPPPAYRPPTASSAGASNPNLWDRTWPNDTKQPLARTATPPVPTRAPPPPPAVSEEQPEPIVTDEPVQESPTSPTSPPVQSPQDETLHEEQPIEVARSSVPELSPVSSASNAAATPEMQQTDVQEPEEIEENEEQPPPIPEKSLPVPASQIMRTRSSASENATSRLTFHPLRQQGPPPLPLPPNFQPPARSSSRDSQAATASVYPKPLGNVAFLKSYFSPVSPTAASIPPFNAVDNKPPEPGPSKRDDELRKHAHKFSESSLQSDRSIPHPYSAEYEEDLKSLPEDKNEEGGAEEEEEEEEEDSVQELQVRSENAANRLSLGLPSFRLSLGPISAAIDNGADWGKGLLDVLSDYTFTESNSPTIQPPEPSKPPPITITSQEKEQKQRSRPSDLTFTRLPNHPQEDFDQSKLSGYSKMSTACSVASEDPSPLWNEIMNMVNPTSEASSQSPASLSAFPKPPVIEPQHARALPQQRPAMPSTPALDVPQFITVPDRMRRISAIRTPPPFPPPMYPPPSPNELDDRPPLPPKPLTPTLPLPFRQNSAPPLSATPSLILPDLASPARSYYSRDESFDGDVSRDSAQLASIRIAEVVRVAESQARTLMPVHNSRLPSPRLPLSPRVPTPTPSLRVASALPLPASPAFSNRSDSFPRSPLVPPTPRSPMPRSPLVRKSEDEPSAIWSYLLEGEAGDDDENDEVLESTPAAKQSAKPKLVLQNASLNPVHIARTSSPTALDEWLADQGNGQFARSSGSAQQPATLDDSPVDPSLRGVPPPTPSPRRRSTQKSKRSHKSNKSVKSTRSNKESLPPTQSLRYTFETSGPPAILRPLLPYIRANADPRQLFSNMRPVAEGQFGNVFAARFSYPDEAATAPDQVVAVKCVSLDYHEKLETIATEMALMSTVIHPNILVMEDMYLDFSEESLWVQMELMDRSVADILSLYDNIRVEETMVARFAKDALSAITFLRQCGIAHRDVRSDNMLLATNGVLKLGDFAHAISAKNGDSTSSDVVGIQFWQAPEVRRGPYDFLKIDVWGVGATVWEVVEGVPPFLEAPLADRWQPLSGARTHSRSLHQFLELCSRPAHSRPEASGLLKTDFVKSACSHGDVVRLLARCRQAEDQAMGSS